MRGAIGYSRTVACLVAFRSAAWGLILSALAFTWVIAECSWRLIEAQASRIRHGLAPDTPKSLELCGAGCEFKASGAPHASWASQRILSAICTRRYSSTEPSPRSAGPRVPPAGGSPFRPRPRILLDPDPPKAFETLEAPRPLLWMAKPAPALAWIERLR